MRVLVTGARGFVGRHLVALLENAGGDTVWKLVNGSGGEVDAHTIQANLLDRPAVDRAISLTRPDVVYHLAAQSSVAMAFKDPDATIHNNVGSQRNLLDAIREAALDPVILVAGSADQYGAPPPHHQPIDESAPFAPRSPYGESKVMQDAMAADYHRRHGMRIIRARPFPHTGPGQAERFAMPSFARQIVNVERGRQEPVIRVGNLDVRRDYSDVRDVVRAYRLLVDRGVPGEAYNIGSRQPRTVGSMLDWLIALSGVRVTVEVDPARYVPADVAVQYADPRKLGEATGWQPEIPLWRTLNDMLEHARAHD
jgi:GDP-4-dehydro-6-deoxy-D-mannose reductase